MGYTVGIDFDGTVVTHEYPRVGRDIGAIPVLKRLVESGNKLILFTMRDSRNGTLQDAINWFKKNGIELYGVNTNPTQADWTDSPKAHCNFYIDDAALGIPKKFDWESGRNYVDWKRVEKLLEEEGLFEDFGEGEDFWKDVEMDGYENNETNESKKNMKVRLTESKLNSIISNSIRRVLREMDETGLEKYYVVYDNEWDQPFKEIQPECVLSAEDINNEENMICVNGKWEYVISEFTNLYADGYNNNPKPGDLVFCVNGSYTIYRRGLHAVCGCDTSMGGECEIGTKEELVAFALEYSDEIMNNSGVDTQAIFMRERNNN